MSNRLRELKEQRSKAIADAQSIHEFALKEKRNLSSEENDQYNKFFDDATKLRDSIDRELSLQKELSASFEDGETLSKGEDSATNFESQVGKVKSRFSNLKLSEKSLKLNKKDYRDAFNAYLTLGKDLSGTHKLALQQGSGPEGGYLVPAQVLIDGFLSEIDELVKMRQLATTFTVQGYQSLGALTVDADLNDAEWTTEFGTGSDDDSLRFGLRELKTNPLAKRVKISKTLIRNSAMNIPNYVMQRLAYKFGVTEEKHFLLGNGTSQPLGILFNSVDGISTDRDVVVGSTTEITADGLINAKFGLQEAFRNSPSVRWIMNDIALRDISKLKDTTGNYIWRENLRVGEPDTIAGIPVMTSAFFPKVFTTGQYVVALGDFSKYYIADSLDMEVQVLDQLYAEKNQVGYIARTEVDGMPVLKSAFVRGRLA